MIEFSSNTVWLITWKTEILEKNSGSVFKDMPIVHMKFHYSRASLKSVRSYLGYLFFHRSLNKYELYYELNKYLINYLNIICMKYCYARFTKTLYRMNHLFVYYEKSNGSA